MPKSAKKAVPELASKSSTLAIQVKPKQTPEQAAAEMVVAGLASNTIATREWSAFPFGEVEVTACLNAIVDSAERVNRGDLGEAEALLMAQAVTLNALFTDLAHQSRTSKYLDQFERYLRLALKAQSQCRATLETLAAMKNPPIVFARQANIAQGAQQVNNTVAVASRSNELLARAGNPETELSKLLDAHGERLDLATSSTAGARDQAMAPLGPRDRTGNG